MKILTICILVCSVLTCKNTENAMTSEKQNSNSITGDYSIISINNQTTNLDGLTISFNEKDSSVFGYSGCNRFTGSFEKKDNNIKIGPLASTRMACEPAKNNIENNVLQALNQITSFEKENDIVLLKKDNAIVLKLLQSQSEMVVTYRAATRGFFEFIEVSEDSLITSKDYNLNLKQTVSTPESTWNELENEINKIDLKTLNNLEAPSKGHQTDRSAMATLKIKVDGQTYETAVFDHGNPPKSIENIVNKVLSMNKTTEKH